MSVQTWRRVSLVNEYTFECVRLETASIAINDLAIGLRLSSGASAYEALRFMNTSGVFLASVKACSQEQRFCTVGRDRKLKPTELGLFAEIQWLDIPNRFSGVIIDKYSIFPDRIQGLIALVDELDECDEDENPHAVTIEEVLEDTVRELRRLVLTSASRLQSFPLLGAQRG